MPHNIPILETEHLRLRPHGVSDFSELAAMWADSAVTRYIGGRPLSSEDCWARLLPYAGHWQLLGFGYWVVARHAQGQGYATEAGRAALDWGDGHFGPRDSS